MNWSNTAFLFPGQGSQIVGMGKDFASQFEVARHTFEEADELLGFSLSTLCFEGAEEELNQTINTQPGIYVCSVAILRVLQQEVPQAMAMFTGGHSLGELTALTAAGSLRFEDGVLLVRERGRLMKEAGDLNPGGMAALLGLDAEQVRQICADASTQTGKPVVLANDNCPGQIVMSGDATALQVAMEMAQKAGAKRVVQLAVSIAAHSPLMALAEDAFSEALEKIEFLSPQMPVYANATGQALQDVNAIRDVLRRQLTQPVRWTECIQQMIRDGAETFLEIGPGDVLTGLMKRINRDKARFTINNVASLTALGVS